MERKAHADVGSSTPWWYLGIKKSKPAGWWHSKNASTQGVKTKFFIKLDLHSNRLAFVDCAVSSQECPPTQTSSSCLILTIHLSMNWPEFEPYTTEHRKYQQTQSLTPGKRSTSNKLWEPVVTLSGTLLKPKLPLCGCCLWKVPEEFCKPKHSGILQTWQHTKTVLSSPKGLHT